MGLRGCLDMGPWGHSNGDKHGDGGHGCGAEGHGMGTERHGDRDGVREEGMGTWRCGDTGTWRRGM